MQEGNQIIFSRWTKSFFVTVSAYFNWGKIYDIFSPCVFIFSLLGHAINCSTFTGGVLGENILSPCVYVFPLAMLYGIYFTFIPRQLLGYELDEKQDNNFPPGPVFFLLVTEKLVRKLMGERKMVFFSHFHIFPSLDHAVFGSPSQTVTVLRYMKMMIFTLGLNVHSSACKLQ